MTRSNSPYGSLEPIITNYQVSRWWGKDYCYNIIIKVIHVAETEVDNDTIDALFRLNLVDKVNDLIT